MLKTGYDHFTFLNFLNQNVLYQLKHCIDDFTHHHYHVYQWHQGKVQICTVIDFYKISTDCHNGGCCLKHTRKVQKSTGRKIQFTVTLKKSRTWNCTFSATSSKLVFFYFLPQDFAFSSFCSTQCAPERLGFLEKLGFFAETHTISLVTVSQTLHNSVQKEPQTFAWYHFAMLLHSPWSQGRASPVWQHHCNLLNVSGHVSLSVNAVQTNLVSALYKGKSSELRWSEQNISFTAKYITKYIY